MHCIFHESNIPAGPGNKNAQNLSKKRAGKNAKKATGFYSGGFLLVNNMN